MTELRSEIEDLRLFNDRMCEFTFREDNGGWLVRMTRKGQDLILRREPDGSILDSRRNEKLARNFRSLLADRRFANLDQMATIQLRMVENAPRYMPTPARLICDGKTDAADDYPQITDWLLEWPDGSIVAIDGPAGAGKTVLIERLMRERAQTLLDRTSNNPLILHIKSGGKALSSFDDRISGTLLEEFDGLFTRAQLPVLARRRIVVPAVDGFDELSDSRGFERAWGALKDYIRVLGNQGMTIIAGRDTMLDLQTLNEGLENTIRGDSTYLLSLEYPDETSARRWFRQSPKWREASREIRDRAEEAIRSSDYLRRPFFLSSFADIPPEEFDRALSGDPLPAIVEGMIRREGRKIAQAAGDASPEIASEIYRDLMIDVSRTMMDYEVDTIEEDYLQLSLDYAFEARLPGMKEEMRKSISGMAGSRALLERVSGSSDTTLRSFSHDMIRSYFHALHVFESAIDPNEPRPSTGLYRNFISTEDFSIFNMVARNRDVDERVAFRRAAMEALRARDATDTLRMNFCGYVLAALPYAEEPDADGFNVGRVSMLDAWLGDADVKGTLREITANNVDLRGADLRHVEFENCEFAQVLANDHTKFGVSLPIVRVLLYEARGAVSRESGEEFERRFAPTESVEFTGPPDPVWPLLETFARAMTRHHYVRMTRDDRMGKKLLDSQHWDALRRLLEEHGRLQQDWHDGGGARDELLQIVNGTDFLKSTPELMDESTRESTLEIMRQLNVRPN